MNCYFTCQKIPKFSKTCFTTTKETALAPFNLAHPVLTCKLFGQLPVVHNVMGCFAYLSASYGIGAMVCKYSSPVAKSNFLAEPGNFIQIGNMFAGCLLYADDIVLLSGSWYGLQKMINICWSFGILWDHSIAR